MTTITPALLAEIREKAEARIAAEDAPLYEWKRAQNAYAEATLPPTALAIVAALEEARRERDAAVKAHNEIAAELTAAQTTAGEEIMKADALRAENEKLRSALRSADARLDHLGDCHGVFVRGEIDAALKETTNAQEG